MNNLFENYKKNEVTNTRRVLYTPNEIVRNCFFYIQEAGYLESIRPHICKRSGLDSYLFIIILSGSGTITYNQTSYHMEPSDCMLIDCHNQYSHISDANNPWSLLWLHFNGPNAAQYYDYITSKSDNHFHSSNPAMFVESINRIIALHEKRSENTDIITSQIITSILTTCVTNVTDEKGYRNSVDKKLEEVFEYINNNYTKNITLEDLSSRFYISKYYLSREFKKEYGLTIIQYILSRRITHAKSLLRFSNLPIEEIGSSAGIDDASYFNKVFKKLEGITPSAYRKSWR